MTKNPIMEAVRERLKLITEQEGFDFFQQGQSPNFTNTGTNASLEITVKRKSECKGKGYSEGELLINGTKFCDTVEDEDRDLTQNDSASKVRQMKSQFPQKTAIPRGRYALKLTKSGKFMSNGYSWCLKNNGLVPLVDNVPGYEGIRIHPGVSAASSAGCIIVGKKSGNGTLTDSEKTYLELFEKIKNSKSMTINIISDGDTLAQELGTHGNTSNDTSVQKNNSTINPYE